MINAIIADDNKDICILLANELNSTKDVKVIKILSNGVNVIQEIKRLHPEIIILDLKMPGKNGLQIIDDIENDVSINTKVIVLSGEMNYISKVRDSRCVVEYISKAKSFKDISLQIKNIANKLSKKSIDQIVMEYLLDLGFSTTNTGTLLLKECIRIFLIKRKDDCKVKELFKVVARKKCKRCI